MINNKILVVDDAASNRALLSGLLRSAGLETEEAPSGEACLKVCESNPPALVLLDVMMPGMDGLEVCRRLRHAHSMTDLAIILVTTNSSDEDVVAGLAAGANDYVTKPVNRKILLARVETHLTLQRALSAMREMEQRESEARRLNSIGIFVTGVAHNFNNLMGSVLGAADLLAKLHDKDPRTQKYVGVIHKAVKSGIRFTGKMIGLVRDDGKTGLRRTDSVATIVSQVLEVQGELTVKDPVFRVSVDPLVPAVAISEVNLAEILTNLVSNSLDAIEVGGEVSVVVTLGQRPHTVRFVVGDDGSGIPDAVQPRLFEPFFTTKNLDTENRVSTIGNGLGLWNVYNLVRALGGEIKVSSEVGKGTEVIFDLPVSVAS